MMDRWRKGGLKSDYSSINFVFANTGLEHEKTLEFLLKVENDLGEKISWIEAKVNPAKGKGTTYCETDFGGAVRGGLLFEEMVRKYGLPNQTYIHCTRELKNNPIKKWCIDRFGGNYEIAIGIRLDERHREPSVNVKKSFKTTYPLIRFGYTKYDVIRFWLKKSYRLEIENYQGNCQACYKKSDSKLHLIAYENKAAFDPFIDMGRKYVSAGSGSDRVIYRKHRKAEDIVVESKTRLFDHNEYKLLRKKVINDYNDGVGEGGCSESCEAFSVMTEGDVKYGQMDMFADRVYR